MFFQLKRSLFLNCLDYIIVKDFFGDKVIVESKNKSYIINILEGETIEIDYTSIEGEYFYYSIGSESFRINLEGEIEKTNFKDSSSFYYYGEIIYIPLGEELIVKKKKKEYKLTDYSFVGHYILGKNTVYEAKSFKKDQNIYNLIKDLDKEEVVLSKNYFSYYNCIYRRFDLNFLKKGFYKNLDKIIINIILCLRELRIKIPKYILFIIFQS